MTTSLPSTFLKGRGLWYGATIYTLAQFESLFAQAASWGIQVVHPKVADGGHLWYSLQELEQIKGCAHKHGLVCVPYHYCYGNTYQALDVEAQLAALIGSTFGAVIPDIEIEWQGHADWAIAFGKTLRSYFGGEVIVTTFANWSDHPLPYREMNEWATGFMPQVYFDVWNNARTGMHMTAQDALLFVYPQWIALSDALATTPKTLVPIYPIIELDNRLAAKEVQNWLVATNKYGYCGFWYDAHYASYAQAIESVAIPGESTSGIISKPTTPTHPVAHPSPSPAHAPVVSPSAPTEQVPTTLAHPVPSGEVMPKVALTEKQLGMLWRSSVKDVVLNPASAIYKMWAVLMTNAQPIGAPQGNEQTVEVEGETMTYMTFTSKKSIVYFHSNGVTCIL